MENFDNMINKTRAAAQVDAVIKIDPSLRWDKTQNKSLRSTFNNMMNFLETDKNLTGLYRFNSFSESIEVCRLAIWDNVRPVPKAFDDNDLLNLKNYLRGRKFEPSMACIQEAVHCMALKNAYNPVVDYLNGLKWDGSSRLDKWLYAYCGADDNPYTQYIGKMTLVAACARVDKPGIKYDHMLILEGAQGIYKSSMLKALGGQWFQEIDLLDRDKDTIEKMRGCWIIEVDELECFKKKEVDSLKSFLSTQVDKIRLPYARNSIQLPRKSIFVGTINPAPFGYLRDRTGNRRFLPVAVGNIDIAGVTRDRDQLWAEAWLAYKAGSPIYINDPSILKYAMEEQREREMSDPWEEPVSIWVEGQKKKGINLVTNTMIYTEAIREATGKMTPFVGVRIHGVMQRLGYHLSDKKKRIDGGFPCNYYDLSCSSEEGKCSWENDDFDGPAPWDV